MHGERVYSVSRDKKLFIEEEEAGRVRMIFRRYLELGSIGLLLADLQESGESSPKSATFRMDERLAASP